MANSKISNPLTSGAVNAVDVVDHSRAVVAMLEESIGQSELQLSEKGALGLALTLQWVRGGLDHAVSELSKPA